MIKYKSCNKKYIPKFNGKIMNNPNDVNGYFTNVVHEIRIEDIVIGDGELDRASKIYDNYASIARIQEQVNRSSPRFNF